MAGQNDFKALATGGSANVLTQSEYAALASLLSNGFQAGVADSKTINKVLRQASVVAAAIGTIIANANIDALDDGNVSSLASALLTVMQRGGHSLSSAGGSADAITASYAPAVTALSNGMPLIFRAAAANATTTPTFTPNSGTIAAKQIVKGAGAALAAGDIAGGGHWIVLQYDLTLDKWVLLNPATGVNVSAGLVASRVQTLSATGNIPLSVVGGTVWASSASAITLTLPAASSVSLGKRIEVMNINTGVATIQRNGTDVLVVNNSSVTSFALNAGDTLTLESNGATAWYVVSGSAQLPFAKGLGKQIVTAWANFDGTLAKGAIAPRASVGISSITKSGTGSYSVTLSTTMADANYVVLIDGNSGSQSDSRDITSRTTTGFTFMTSSNNVVSDWATVGLAVIGNI